MKTNTKIFSPATTYFHFNLGDMIIIVLIFMHSVYKVTAIPPLLKCLSPVFSKLQFLKIIYVFPSRGKDFICISLRNRINWLTKHS